jgi:hypothetical protein
MAIIFSFLCVNNLQYFNKIILSYKYTLLSYKKILYDEITMKYKRQMWLLHLNDNLQYFALIY